MHPGITARPRVPLFLLCSDHRLGIARLPKALFDAGFDVFVLAREGSFIRKSKFLREFYNFPSEVTPASMVAAVKAAILQSKPRVILGGDETAALFLQTSQGPLRTFAEQYSPNVIVGGMMQSLGDTIVRKTRIQEIARSIGLPLPKFLTSPSMREMLLFAKQLNWRVVFKEDGRAGGTGVTICADESTVMEFLQSHSSEDVMVDGVTAQEFVSGPVHTHTFVAVQGEWLEGYSLKVLQMHPTPNGPSTVVEFQEMPEVDQMARAIVRATGFTGFGGIDVILDDRTGKPCFLELNPRAVPTSHLGKLMSRDLSETLYSAVTGIPRTQRGELFTRPIALFPKELIRDRQSCYVRDHYHDVPWDDPELLAAYLKKISAPPAEQQSEQAF